MAVDQRKRQKKLQKRAAKHKAEKKAIARQRSGGVASILRDAAHAPIFECRMSAELFDHGIGYVILTRRLKAGDVLYTNFLLDVWCLGVKDVIVQVLPASVYHEQVGALEEQFELEDITPACARKLVEGAVEFAAKHGLAPHPDYRIGQLAFADVNAAECHQEFAYGQDGKAFYVAGPHDSVARSRQIANTIKAADPDSHYMVPIHESMVGEARLPEWEDVMVIDEAQEDANE